MSYKIIPTETFKTQVRTLQKKYPHIRQDLKNLSKRLKHNPKSGKALGKGIYKIRSKSPRCKARKLAQSSRVKAQRAIVISPFQLSASGFQLFCNAADWVFSAESSDIFMSYPDVI